MSEFFKYFGIAIFILFVDALVCLGMIAVTGSWEDDDLWFGPLILNVLGFAVVTAVLIGERMG